MKDFEMANSSDPEGIILPKTVRGICQELHCAAESGEEEKMSDSKPTEATAAFVKWLDTKGESK